MGFLFPQSDPPDLIQPDSPEARAEESRRRRLLAARKGRTASILTDDDDGRPGIEDGSQTIARKSLLGE